jgi:hypothetical protein
LYRNRSLLPLYLDEPAARVLAGEAPMGTEAKLGDLRALRDTLSGDDAPSRLVMSDLCTRFTARAIVLVALAPVEARAFDCAARTFLRAAYFPDDPVGHSWIGAVHALTLTFGSAAPAPTPSGPTVSPKKSPSPEGAPFYKSWWFWGAIGGAVAIGSTALIVANTGGSSQIEMQMHIPR